LRFRAAQRWYQSRVNRIVRGVGAWLVWWTALFWLWFLLVGEWNRIELVAAASAATVSASFAEVVRAKAGMRFVVPLRLVSELANALGMVVVDFGIVMTVLFRSLARRNVHRGQFVVRDLDVVGDDPRAFGERAFRTFAANFSPNAYVIDMDPDQRSVLLHDLVVFRKSEEPA
jgi:hypothetical protein